VGIRCGKIAAISEHLGPCPNEIDAADMLVMPGGIDSHVHIAQDTPDVKMADDFTTGSQSAAAGGNTTFIPFVVQPRGASLRQCVEGYHRLADGQSHVDYGFHLIVTDPSAVVLGQELPALVRDGYTSFKVFMTYDDMVLNDRQLLDVFDCARRERALVMVHCEGYDTIKFMTERLEAQARTQPFFHAMSRPEPIEREATHRAISFSELIDVPIMIVHVSGREAMEQVRWAQQKGLKIYAETCPQYISLTADDLKGIGSPETGGKYVCSPPPRDRDSWEAIWEGIRLGVFSTFSSDHCPFYYDSPQGKLSPKGKQSFRWIPNGIPGVETRMQILFSEGVVKGRISLEQFVALTSTNHAKMYGLYPKKGSIAIGCDADVVIWDPKSRHIITQSGLHHGSDYTPWEGFEVTGCVVKTILRGRIIYDSTNDTALQRRPAGQFMKRRVSSFAAPQLAAVTGG
jgi:dihydropyrimidinase